MLKLEPIRLPGEDIVLPLGSTMVMAWFDRLLNQAEEEVPQYPVENWAWKC